MIKPRPPHTLSTAPYVHYAPPPPVARRAQPRWRPSWSMNLCCVSSRTSASTGSLPGPPIAAIGTPNPRVPTGSEGIEGFFSSQGDSAAHPHLPGIPGLACHLAESLPLSPPIWYLCLVLPPWRAAPGLVSVALWEIMLSSRTPFSPGPPVGCPSALLHPHPQACCPLACHLLPSSRSCLP